MDFIAEMVLGYADTELPIEYSKQIFKIIHIIRYRDDYRIFSNNPQDAVLPKSWQKCRTWYEAQHKDGGF
jgi:hypothetical protein